jgi:integrase
VPYRLVHSKLDVFLTATMVSAFLRGERVASHARSFIPAAYTTVAEHMPPAHQANVQRLLRAVDRSTARGLRDYSLLLLMSTYFGAGEAIRLQFDDIDWIADPSVTVQKRLTHIRELLEYLADRDKTWSTMALTDRYRRVVGKISARWSASEY